MPPPNTDTSINQRIEILTKHIAAVEAYYTGLAAHKSNRVAVELGPKLSRALRSGLTTAVQRRLLAGFPSDYQLERVRSHLLHEVVYDKSINLNEGLPRECFDDLKASFLDLLKKIQTTAPGQSLASAEIVGGELAATKPANQAGHDPSSVSLAIDRLIKEEARPDSLEDLTNNLPEASPNTASIASRASQPRLASVQDSLRGLSIEGDDSRPPLSHHPSLDLEDIEDEFEARGIIQLQNVLRTETTDIMRRLQEIDEDHGPSPVNQGGPAVGLPAHQDDREGGTFATNEEYHTQSPLRQFKATPLQDIANLALRHDSGLPQRQRSANHVAEQGHQQRVGPDHLPSLDPKYSTPQSEVSQKDVLGFSRTITLHITSQSTVNQLLRMGSTKMLRHLTDALELARSKRPHSPSGIMLSDCTMLSSGNIQFVANTKKKKHLTWLEGVTDWAAYLTNTTHYASGERHKLVVHGAPFNEHDCASRLDKATVAKELFETNTKTLTTLRKARYITDLGWQAGEDASSPTFFVIEMAGQQLAIEAIKLGVKWRDQTYDCTTFDMNSAPCGKCQGFGHQLAQCGNKRACRHCAGGHRSHKCKASFRSCVNCNGSHSADCVRCPVLKDRIVQKLLKTSSSEMARASAHENSVNPTTEAGNQSDTVPEKEPAVKNNGLEMKPNKKFDVMPFSIAQQTPLQLPTIKTLPLEDPPAPAHQAKHTQPKKKRPNRPKGNPNAAKKSIAEPAFTIQMPQFSSSPAQPASQTAPFSTEIIKRLDSLTQLFKSQCSPSNLAKTSKKRPLEDDFTQAGAQGKGHGGKRLRSS